MASINKGRQRIEIEPIVKRTNRLVTFSKRRRGLFNKASELCILCGTEVAIITFSPAGKAYCFGHPSANAVISKYLQENNIAEPSDPASLANLSRLKRECEAMEKELEEEQRKTAIIKEQAMNDANNGRFWWDSVDIKKLGMEDLKAYIAALEQLKDNVGVRSFLLNPNQHL